MGEEHASSKVVLKAIYFMNQDNFDRTVRRDQILWDERLETPHWMVEQLGTHSCSWRTKARRLFAMPSTSHTDSFDVSQFDFNGKSNKRVSFRLLLLLPLNFLFSRYSIIACHIFVLPLPPKIY